MKTIILVSKCTEMIELGLYRFHFKGAFNGSLLKDIQLKCPLNIEILPGQEYLLYVRVLALEGSTLYGTILKTRPLDECRIDESGDKA